MDPYDSHSAQSAEPASAAPIYTEPELRERLKDELLASDRGGRPGEWNAHKAQLLAHEYRQAGGRYTFAKRNDTEPAWHPPAEGAARRSAASGHHRSPSSWTAMVSAQRQVPGE